MAKGYFTPFTEIQKQHIIDNYMSVPVKRLAEQTNSSYGRIMRFLKSNNLHLPIELINQRKIDSYKKKRDVPFNKGKKQTEYMSPEMIAVTARTRFKKGIVPANTNKEGNGAIVIRKDTNGRSYKYIRIEKGIWKLYHRLIWEQVNGEIPENHIVAFKDDNPLNTSIENLELITMAENMLRNSKHKYPKEIIPSMVLYKKLETKLKSLQNG